ncbi:MAG TPA: methylenetetrahydrofolate reductase [NAD(P)H] [Desulfotomaculum sp.]|nr:MAG: Methylenetetrahydrofolate reductase [Parcubacteria bacterium 33_209]HAG09824.1 methylenetetrahydrofolate reductase [NAD(P)H] [Desulfotomaculum sp.]HBY03309.1 methylenetetrahydrofolate reductase [NAD(P)H] [Desulfotomaculum sp.]
MKTVELFKVKTVLSFEVFPPKKTSSLDTIYKTLNELSNLSPDYISVTYSAGGSDNGESTVEISSTIKNQYHIESVAHLTCISQTKEEVLFLLERLRVNNIENILALRGDINPDIPPKQDFKYASDLISFIKKNSDFNILAACYPEGHIEVASIAEDIRNLKIKVENGVDHLISQLFFDNNYFYAFLERAEHAGITVPIEAGIMPVVNRKQIERMVSLCGVDLPKKFTAMMNRYENNSVAMRDAGIAYAVDQIVDLVSQGVDGIHLYTMNNAYIAQKINEAVKSLFISPRW